MAVTLAELVVADPPEAWTAAGFAVDADGTCRVGTVAVRLVGPEAGRGIVGWTLRADVDGDLDGIPTTRSTAEPPAPAEHLNRVSSIDDFEQTVDRMGEMNYNFVAADATGISLRVGIEVPRRQDVSGARAPWLAMNGSDPLDLVA